MKKVITVYLLLLLIPASFIYSQNTEELFYAMLDSILTDRLVDQYPDKMCDDNNGLHTYMGELTIEKINKSAIPLGPNRFEDRWMLTGLARADHQSSFLSGSSRVQIMGIARQNFFGKWEIIKVKWKKNSCMQYATLMDMEEEEKMAAELSPDSDLDFMMEKITEEENEVRIEEVKPEVLELEHPGQFIEIIANIPEKKKKKQPDMLLFQIQNHASLTTFKDVKINVSFLSKTETILHVEEYTFYEYFEPKGMLEFQREITIPEFTEKVRTSFVEAIPIE